MTRLRSLLASRPLYVFLLPLFFVLHGFVSYFFLVPVGQALSVFFIYTAFFLLIQFLFRIVFRDWKKGALAALFVMAFQFFFGAIIDFMKGINTVAFLTKYSFLLPFAIGIFLLWLFYLKRAKSDFKKLTLYLNALLVLLILIDAGNLVVKPSNKVSILEKNEEHFTPCLNCATPDIYFIVLDEYPGKKELKDIFAFDNSEFENQLQQRGFHVSANSRSNYNWTPYSLASTLNMTYLHLNTTVLNMYDLLSCENAMQKSTVVSFLENSGYSIYNFSPFDLDGNPASLKPLFLSPRKRLITSPTFTYRFEKELGFHFMSKENLARVKKMYWFNNQKALGLTRQLLREKNEGKKFVYTHLMLPHHPYFYDSTGRERPVEELGDSLKMDKNAFISYLVYSNKKILELIDDIRTNAKKEPVIILMSDHGYRQFNDNTDHSYYFMNINAVSLPGKNYDGFYDGMSNVNQFRVLLNQEFGQKLTLLKDSSIFLWEK